MTGSPKEMRLPRRPVALALALALALPGLSVAPPAWADPPGGFKHGKDHDRGDDAHGHGHGKAHDDDHGGAAITLRFEERDRVVVHDYYAGVGARGRCPPGLAKKHNGCLPPGQAKPWALGRPLPREVIFYDLPPALVVQLRPAPAGYRYVRVASDILMIAAGTGLVAAAIEDLGRH
jgi:hypothetical protein